MQRLGLSSKKREIIFLKTQGKCADCGMLCQAEWKTNWSGRVRTFVFNGTHEIHHIIPLYKGGSEHYNNLVLLCLSCHRARHVIEKREK